MAAFIQKLFKRRKATVAPTPDVAPEPPRQSAHEQQLSDQRAILAESPSQQQAESLATEGVTADIRLSAAQLLVDTDALARVQKLARTKDKGVYQIVRQKLQSIREREQEAERLSERVGQLLKQAADQATSDDTKLYEARLEALKSQWATVQEHASAAQKTDFQAATLRCRERADALQADRAEVQRHQEQAGQRTSTLELLTSTLESLKNTSSSEPPSVPSLDALQKTQENRWLEATRDTEVSRSEQKQYQTLMPALKRYIAAARQLEHQQDLLQGLRADPEASAEQIRQALDSLAWPSEFPLPALLNELHRRLKKEAPAAPPAETAAADQQAQVARLETSLKTLEAALEARQLKESRQAFKTAQQQHRTLDQRHGRPFQARLQLLAGQLKELSDWQGFATEPKQIALCEQMEYLAEQPIEPEAKAARIKELQNEWRDLGGSPNRELWARFKQASDAAYEPCKAYFAAKSELKQVNLEKRRLICSQLSTYVEQTDWARVDWKAAEQIHRTARDEWKAAWPVEFRDNRAVQKQFDELLKRIEAPLNQEREKNEALKADIVARAEALIHHEPLAEALEQAKSLQTEWEAIGVTRHREDRKLWRSFRTACDQVFGRREAQRNAREVQTRDADQRANTLLAEVTADLANGSLPADVLAAHLGKLATLEPEPLSRTMREQVRQARQQIEDLQQQQKLQARVTQWKQWIESSLTHRPDPAGLPQHWPQRAASLEPLTMHELVIRAEIVSGAPSPAEDQALRMEVQVKRLAEGITNGTGATNNFEQLETLIAGWCLTEADADKTPPLALRLIAALESVTA
ncbi:DUF349 domain-containing protein [Marinobacter sp. X15-166B]|uniref:DUF349 domain-containing protein n=1 Tax=Marinobacter sp. X15-166B TaxID=1897620 RepID=UPI00085CDEFF|nr:DUF349 domain-containing protein [Marinobacter sp. X15-166B]OEY65018.1 hypothetical protein BG841_00050 [Marinobacter sp. X15-166B]